MIGGFREDTRTLAILNDDLRMEIFLFVRRQFRAVSREEVAEGLGISRKLAAFHLDKLDDAGLLVHHFARPEGRSGPGAGRPAKRYRPSEAAVDVSVPPKRYELAARLLLQGVGAQSPHSGTGEAVRRAARREGLRMGAEARTRLQLEQPNPERLLSAVAAVLEEHGFEPARTAPEEAILRNCPFRSLAEQDAATVCRMNLELIEGLLDALEATGVEAVLQPGPGYCCVRLRLRG